MKKIELHKANNLSHGATIYRKGVIYKVSDGLFEELVALKNPRHISYFRVPLTAAQKKEILARSTRARETAGMSESRVNDGTNIIKVDEEDGAGDTPEKPEVVTPQTGSGESTDSETESGDDSADGTPGADDGEDAVTV